MLINNKEIADPYIFASEKPFNILSIFDDLRYDRSDVDILSPSMRRYIAKLLASQGFKQKSGSVFQDKARDIRCIIPKTHALGASPFDITRYSPKREQDYYILTPTQTACQFVDRCSLEEAVEKIGALVAKHPINLLKLQDYLEDKEKHKEFLAAIPHIRYLQRIAVESEPLKRLRSLKW